MNAPLTPLRKFRKDQGKTLDDLAPEVGVTAGQLSRIERQGTESLTTALKLSEVTGLPVEAFTRPASAA